MMIFQGEAVGISHPEREDLNPASLERPFSRGEKQVLATQASCACRQHWSCRDAAILPAGLQTPSCVWCGHGALMPSCACHGAYLPDQLPWYSWAASEEGKNW